MPDPHEKAGEACDVLVVDDEPVVLSAARRVLEAAGLSVTTAADARSALAHPSSATCRVLLCDLMLPDRPGTEVMAALRARRPNLPVVLTTGLINAETLDHALEGSGASLLLKPFDESELLAAVLGALEPLRAPNAARSPWEEST